MKKSFFTTAILICLSMTLFGQDMVKNAQVFLQDNVQKLGLAQSDISDMTISDQYTSRTSGVTNIYFQQTHKGIGVYNGILNIHLTRDGEVLTYGNRFIANLKAKASTDVPTLTAIDAVNSAARALDYSMTKPIQILEPAKGANKEILLSKGNISQKDIPAKLVWQIMSDKKAHLSWDLSIHEPSGQNWWSVRIDAQTGELLTKTNWIVTCNWGDHDHANHNHAIAKKATAPAPREISVPEAEMNALMSGSYRVLPIDIESPSHGPFSLVNTPHDVNASPFGWHDDNGVAGAEYTITRGNNVYAQEDQNGDNGFGFAPDGGPGLVFDFPFDPSIPPTSEPTRSAAITNLFYWNNVVHDVLYHYGFTEECGNFQTNNYGNGGAGNDFVIADAQDGSGTNNANFGTPPDGSNPQMQMFLWNAAPTFMANSPASVAGGYAIGTASFGPTNFDVTGDLVEINDNTAPVTDGCEDAINALPAGSIALIDRGSCGFSCKVVNGENAGAAGVIICNNLPNDGAPGMAATAGCDPTIPAISLSLEDCTTLRAAMGSSTVNVTMVNNGVMIDGDFDNGIIAHEYGHGVSNRFTAGPANTGCLGNQEQMGEGWSDFIGLYLTTNSSNSGPEGRGIGTYAQGQPTTGGGIRPFPYSTDMAGVNPHTYDDIMTAAVPHGVGSVWCVMLWELYWAMVDEYGFSDDLYFGDAGNNRAFRLVMEGMKLQPCNPGFVDGRDAILAADKALYGGANACLIWEAFAKRGLGFSASQGGSGSVTDGVEAFDMPPTCKLNVVTVVDKLLAGPGSKLQYTITVTNLSADPLVDILIENIIPPSTTHVPGSGGSEAGGTVSFPTFDLAVGETRILTFCVTIDAGASVDPFDFVDDVESGTSKWNTQATAPSESEWIIASTLGNSVWFAEDVAVSNEQYLILAAEEMITGTSTLNFQHNYDTEATWDGGLVQISTDNGCKWTDLGPLFTLNGYNSTIDNNADTPAFSGNSGGYINSIVDLSSYADQFVLIRFWMHCDVSVGGNGWYVDDIMITDLLPSIPNTTEATCGSDVIEVILDNPTLISNSLPLDLVNFTGTALAKTNQLAWTTANEVDIASFVIERSVDGKEDWTFVGKQVAKGQSSSAYTYQMQDVNPLPLAFYRLKTIETNGQEAMSNIILIERSDRDIKDIKVYPNPVNDVLNLEFSATLDAEVNMVIENVLGQQQMNVSTAIQKGMNQQQLDVSRLSPGVYWLALRTDAGTIWSGKIVVD